MPPPTAAIVAKIHAILKDHNTIEKGWGICIRPATKLASSGAAQRPVRLQAAQEVAVLPCSESPAAMSAVQRAVERAGYASRER
jgi:hypothetical protein